MEAKPRLIPFDAATARVEALVAPLAAELVRLAEASGRVLARNLRAAAAVPAANQALADGFAVRAEATLGAAAYNPLDLPLLAIATGDALPPGTDAVVALDAAEPSLPGHIAVVEAVAPGQNVMRRGATAAAGAVVAADGTRLAARHLGLLAAAGIAQVPVIRRPRVAILLVAIAAVDTPDANAPMLRAAVARDGGIAADAEVLPRDRPAIAAALAAVEADMALLAGGTGPGADDHAAAALAGVGELAFHGVALLPGESAGFGRTSGGMPVALLPGMPAACLCAYELLAGRAVRRLGGRDPALPYRVRRLRVARKLVSAIGVTEVCPIRLGPDDTVEPLPSLAEIGLAAAAAADGFVVVAAEREGYPPGAEIGAYLYEDA
jgi:molybdopterin molybdotransferase